MLTLVPMSTTKARLVRRRTKVAGESCNGIGLNSDRPDLHATEVIGFTLAGIAAGDRCYSAATVRIIEKLVDS